MNRRQADVAAGALIASVLLLGVVSAVQLHLADGAMGGRMDDAPVLASFAPLLMSLVVAGVLGGAYAVVRSHVFAPDGGDAPSERTSNAPTDDAEAVETFDQETSAGGDESADRTETTDPSAAEASESAPDEASEHRQLLDVLPDDERRILTPVIESPGLTQIEVRDRSGFSKSKVSQTITDLERRGLLYREPQGRTYRVYPADDLDGRS